MSMHYRNAVHDPPVRAWWAVVAVWIVVLVMAGSLTACWAIPVRAVPSDEPILVAPVGEAAGVTMNANLPQPDPAKFPPAASTSAGWSMLGQIALAALGLGGGGAAVVARMGAGRLRKALTMTAQLVDHVAEAETPEDVAKAKQAAAMAQEAAGVRTLIQSTRGKV